MSDLVETVETLLMEYSNSLEYAYKSRRCRIKCSFCNRSFKYQLVLNEHAMGKHMDNLKNLTNDEQRMLILDFIKSDSKMLYQDYHQRFFHGEK